MKRYGFLYDQKKCIGCNACQMACKDKNNLEAGMFYRRAATVEFSKDGKMSVMHYSGACNHCDDAVCMLHCPTGALYRRSDGTVGHNAGKCIGCGLCTRVCPYGAPKLSRIDGKSHKCTSCTDLREQGKNPACVDACLTHCLAFTDYDTLGLYKERKGDYPWQINS